MDFKEIELGDGTVEVEIGTRQLVCPVCGGNRFHERNSLMNTRAAAIFKFEWANAAAHNYICIGCAYVFWFLRD